MRARIEPMAAGEDLDIPMPAMTPSYRVGVARQKTAMDPGTRRLAIFAGGIGGALVLLVGIWSFTGHHQGGVPVIEPDSRPVRVKPANPGGMQIAGANDSLFSGDSDGKQVMAPPPEVPQPQALKAEEKAAVATAAPPPPAKAEPAPAPAAASPAAPFDAVKSLRRTETESHAAEPPKPVAAREARDARHPAPVPLTPPASRSDLGVAARPAVLPATRSAHGVLVQLAALESEGAARTEWKRLERRYGSLLDGHAPSFTHTEHAGRTFWRVRTGGFTDVAQAVAFCHRVKAKGGGCAVASF